MRERHFEFKPKAASILFLITAASIYSRMLGLAGLPNELGDMLANSQASFFTVMLLYVLLMLFLGTLLDTASIILIVVPLFLPLGIIGAPLAGYVFDQTGQYDIVLVALTVVLALAALVALRLPAPSR